MRPLIIVFFTLIFITSCKKEVSLESVAAQEAVKAVRFDQLFYHKSDAEIQELKKMYPFLFPVQVPDTVWVNKSNNQEEIFLQQEVQKVFTDFKSEEKQLGELFKTIKSKFPNFKSPKVITLISDIDYESKVIYADSLLLISLDMYLGKDHEIYKEFPSYLSYRYEKSNLIVDVAHAIADNSFKDLGRNNFLNQMINQGKKMSLVNAFLPETKSDLKMAYTPEQMLWVESNEFSIWQYFMENQMLYSYDIDLLHRFVFDAPFSKFYLESDQDSPGRIGVWIGWKIVDSYLKNNEVSLDEMIKIAPEELFEKSRYKPKK
ncbi:MAG TPA: gliding motility lipoprotein GldB [Flavobacteriaceae bacterium]|nr:gliding motility lipoprotein GldB [Flavobacteriaceae bacterium]HEX5743303.1 gliding motility lipoprotein GldB [Flavobacteriaceae bacterium]